MIRNKFMHRGVQASNSDDLRSLNYYREFIHELITDAVNDLDIVDELFINSDKGTHINEIEWRRAGKKVADKMQDVQVLVKAILKDVEI